MTGKAGLAVVAATFVLAVGYLLQLAMARIVLPADFAFLQESLALYMMAMLPLQPIGAVVTKQAARHESRLWSDVTRPSFVAFSLLLTIVVFVSTRVATPFGWDRG